MTSYTDKLAARVAAQASACIGCNDCLLACPIPESRNVTIAELNAAVRLPVIGAPHVVAFLSACTQCKQCVPACPADLDRSEMVLVNKLKVEDAVPNHELLLQARERVSPSGYTLDGLAQGLAALEIFRGAPVVALRRLLQKSTLRWLAPGEALCKDGDFYERLAVVLSGSLVQTSTGPKGELFHLIGLGPGSFLGEVGVLGDCPEPYGALAREASVVLEAPKLAVLRLMEQAPSVGDTLEVVYARHALWNHARKPGSLGTLPEAAVLELFAEAKLELVQPGEALFSQGDAPRDFFLVRNGFLRAARRDGAGERVLTYFREGDALGLASLLQNEPAQSFTALAVGRAEVVRVSGEALRRLFARYPNAYAGLAQGALEAERLARSAEVGVGPLAVAAAPSQHPLGPYVAAYAPGSAAPSAPYARPSVPSAPPSASGPGAASLPRSSNYERVSGERVLAGAKAPLEAGVLVEEGIATGREVLVVDQNLCTSCGNCIDACERRHGTSRLQLRGLQIENYMFPTACRHCADPACLLCSVNGIVRLPSGEIQIVEDNCIGCGACAERCPYGNISMHAVERKKRGFFPTLFDFLVRGAIREQALDAIDPKTLRVAVKCDLCAGHGDYACVTACPVGANFRVDPGALVASKAT
ncbi:MAG TPA: cyclic nucleotide-binding domain-containing protein [Polyangiaceae bacterium]|nr:cyclic nucleotide-binding domain-containing protein [Polyangiaceae bacterium]